MTAAPGATGGQTEGPAGSTAVGGNKPAAADASAPAQAPLPTNYQTQKVKQKKQKKPKQPKNAVNPPAAPTGAAAEAAPGTATEPTKTAPAK